MSRNLPPRDALAGTHMWVPVDATGTDFYALGQRFGTQVGVLSEVHDPGDVPYVTAKGTGFFDPRCLRWHGLGRTTPSGIQDNRLSVQVVTDYEAEYADPAQGDAPFGQPEYFTAQNRTTREADTKGRVALTTSHRRIIDSEDDRYALALTCRSVPLGTAELLVEVATETDPESGAPLPEGVHFREAGSGSVPPGSTVHGGVTTTAASVSVGGVTFFGGAAVRAARAALSQGGSAADAARAASAAARGLPPPPLLDAGTTRERGTNPGPEQPEPPPEPDRNPQGSVPLLNHPKGYVWSEAGPIGLMGTLVVPEGASGAYFHGREGTPIGPLPLRHDAQVSMGPELVGRMVFVRNDAAEVPEGTGKPLKGELWADSSRANIDTELGLETTQWRPVIRVDADLPPSREPPEPPLWIDPPKGEEKKKKGKGKGKGKGTKPPKPPTGGGGGGQPPGGSQPPPPGVGPGVSGGILVAGGGAEITLLPPRREAPDGVIQDGDLQPTGNAGAQARDYEGPGEPCPNATSGVLVEAPGVRIATGETTSRVGGLPVIPVPGGFVQFSGYPGVTPVPGGLLVGGEQSHRLTLGLPTPPGRGSPQVDPAPPGGVPRGAPAPGDEPGELPLGLPTPPGGGVRVDPAPAGGVPRGQPVPGDDPGRIPLGLHGTPGPGFGFGPPLGGGRGIPRGAGERFERAQRRAQAAQRRREAERREQERIDELQDLEDMARAAGRNRFADRVERAREKIEKRRQKRQERAQRRQDYKDRIRREREERARRRKERKAEKRRKREARRRRRNRERQAREERGETGRGGRRRRRRPPQGGYLIDVTDGQSRALSTGLLTEGERRALEEDQQRREERRRRYHEEVASFGDWNTANMPLPFFGAEGGPRSLEDWAHLATYQVRAVQQVVNGAFGGPSYLASNVGLMHRNRPGNPPAGSRIGAHWTAWPHEPQLKIGRGQAPVEVVSILEAPAGTHVEACAGGVLEVVREHRGEGQVDDHRPLILLENERSLSEGAVQADMISDVARRFYVSAGACVTATKLRAHAVSGEKGPALEVGRIDPETGDVAERWVMVDTTDGVLVAEKGLRSRETVEVWGSRPLVLHPPPGEVELAYELRAIPGGVLRLATTLGPEFPITLGVDGQLDVTGDVSIAGKLFVKGSIDPTDLQLDPQSQSPIPQNGFGLWVSDGTTPGTIRGGLYYERFGRRVRLDA